MLIAILASRWPAGKFPKTNPKTQVSSSVDLQPYVSDFSGREEVYIRPFLAEGNGKQVSVQGGTEPLWSPDGKEIFYREYDKLMAVSVKNYTPLTLSPPKMLFEGPFKTTDYGGGQANYYISQDANRFLMINQISKSKLRVIKTPLNTKHLIVKQNQLLFLSGIYSTRSYI